MENLRRRFYKWNKRLVQKDEAGLSKLRIWHRRKKGKQSPSILVKCGDCDSKFEIYYGGEDLEIGGVLASKVEWRRVFLPLLK
ncbi:MAG: hypothetical protein A3G34_13685 [Candidatus Lindowbacteria bacterium RIFCSPLOWO2_12_FULL_62_27]|nr:MAG: hypothetical protein A3I06_14365 [Candidatus Lindowbacteria bacterium RIFCSPLOWO2_02_FULL_62_12]OGH62630.1 MAG: hypothetical protein A3G34_13685 [Candidatus Lindowbacteria bacterium RIFCSPLOWO2_12_FULL_62_27]